MSNEFESLDGNGAEMRIRKKIALVNVFFPPQSIGGATRVVADNIEVLRRDYHDQIELVAFTSNALEGDPHRLNVYSYRGMRVYQASVLWRVNMDWHFVDEEMGKLFDEFLVFERPDLIHFHCIQRLSGSIVEMARARNVPYLVTVHDAWWISDFQFLVDADGDVYREGHPNLYAPLPLPEGVSFQQSVKRRLHLRELLGSAEKVLAVSESFADLYRKNGIDNVAVNKNGISDQTTWRDKDTSYTPRVVVGHIGGMSEHKGYFLFKEAVETLRPKDIEVLVVDHGQDEDYRQQSDWEGVPVTFVGRVSQENIVDLYTKIDVLFAPSIWPESFGLVTREAAACGCWIVASDIGGLAEDVQDRYNGLKIEAGSLPALTEALEWIVENAAKIKSIAPKTSLRLASEQVRELSQYYFNNDNAE
ncbi:MAG: glycosyltransferase family 4 protein [Gammaproteobacteria bacterium]